MGSTNSFMESEHDQTGMLVVAISSGALFNLDDSNKVYNEQGVDAYISYQIEKENVPLRPGNAFRLVQKLLELNKKSKKCLTEVILLSRNSADTGLRVFNSIAHHDLAIKRAAFTNGAIPYPYLNALGAHLFLSARPDDTKEAIANGCAAATIFSDHDANDDKSVFDDVLRIAFDGDAVLFSDDTEILYREKGLEAVRDNEKKLANEPLSAGPFHDFVIALSNLQSEFEYDLCPIRTALVTARSAPSHERVIKTLRAWGVRLDEAFFLGGKPKGEVLSAFKADIFFDDQSSNCKNSSKFVTTGHVPYGIGNEEKKDIENI